MIQEIVRVGIVTGINPERGTVRVHLVDVDDQVSYELPVIYRKTNYDKEYWMPDIGEHVVCIFSGQGLEQGFVIGAIYSQADSTPVTDKDKFHIKFKDGTEIEYDRAEHKYRVYVEDGEIEIIAKKKVTIKAPIIRMQGFSPSDIAFEGDFRIIGNLYVEGNIHSTGTIVDDGGNTNHHSH